MTHGRAALLLGLCTIAGGCSKRRAESGKAVAEPERLLLAIASCSLGPNGLTACDAHLKLHQALQHDRGDGPKLGLKHLAHSSPAVRVVAAGLLRPVFSSQPEALAAVARAAQTDRDPSVRTAMINVLGTRAKEPPVSELLLRTADDADEVVRVESVGWLSSRWGKRAPGAVEKVIEKMLKDPSLKVRRAACGYAGRMSAVDKVLPVLERLTAKVDDPELYSSCLHALIDLWNPRHFIDPPSHAAYALSVARLRRKPRSHDQPPWNVIGDFGRAPGSPAPWYKRREINEVLSEIAVDDNADLAARVAAARALGEVKAVGQLNQIKTRLAAKTDDDSQNVVKAADEGLAKAK
jgi:hypothetical protein